MSEVCEIPLTQGRVALIDAEDLPLASAYGWDFIEQVMTPAVGADPITAREREIEHEKREIAAREARLRRLRASVEDRAVLRMVPQ